VEDDVVNDERRVKHKLGSRFLDVDEDLDEFDDEFLDEDSCDGIAIEFVSVVVELAVSLSGSLIMSYESKSICFGFFTLIKWVRLKKSLFSL
jgi:hypothetical protein